MKLVFLVIRSTQTIWILQTTVLLILLFSLVLEYGLETVLSTQL